MTKNKYDFVNEKPVQNGETKPVILEEDLEKSGDEPEREQWGRKIDFILSCVGFAVGLGNVWRFPYLCYKNGGGAFLIPYAICLICGGVPVFFLEISLGQFMAQGGLGVWKLVPLFYGIGIATTVIVFYLNIYYIVILAWDVYYMVMAFAPVLPWSHCNNPWNTDRCRVSFLDDPECSGLKALNGTNITAALSYSEPEGALNSTGLAVGAVNISARCLNHTWPANFTPVDPVVEFWENQILQISPGVDQPNGIVWQLALALLFCWVGCYFCVWKGVKWTGKVVYFTATFPYVVLCILLVRGVTLPGSTNGIIFYLKPEWSRLADVQVWIDAGTQIFFSYAIALGAMTALGSYNKFHNNCYKDVIIISVINSFTSLFAGFVIFSVLGFMAYEQGVSVADVAESGPGLAFIAYPKAVTQMPLAPAWAVLFFLMIVMLGLDSQFVGMEAFVTVAVDMFPKLLRKSPNREIFIALYSLVSYLIGLSMCTRGGMYVFQMFDYYSASGIALLWVCFFEAIAVAWVFGVKRYYDCLEVMLGFRINPWFMITWFVLTPLVTMSIFIFSWVDFKPLKYNKTYIYPAWAQAIGLCMAFSSMICIPVYAIYAIVTTPGTLKQRMITLTTPRLKPYQIPDHWPKARSLETSVPFINKGNGHV